MRSYISRSRDSVSDRKATIILGMIQSRKLGFVIDHRPTFTAPETKTADAILFHPEWQEPSSAWVQCRRHVRTLIHSTLPRGARLRSR